MSPYKVVYGKSCHLHVEMENKVCSAIEMLKFGLTEAGEERRLQLSELAKIKVKAYERARSYKEKAKLFHDKQILRKEFAPGMKVFWCRSKLNLFPKKFRSGWMGSYIISRVFPYGALKYKTLSVVPSLR